MDMINAKQKQLLCLLCVILVISEVDLKKIEAYSKLNVCAAKIRYTFRNADTGLLQVQEGDIARYAHGSPLDTVSGQVIHVQTDDGHNHGCTAPVNVPSSGPWIALVQRGMCKFGDKILNTVVLGNASALIIYNHKEEEQLVTMEHGFDDVVSVFMGKGDGDRIALLADNHLVVNLSISVGEIIVYDIKPARSGPSPWLYISLACIGLLVLGLGVLLICGLRKSGYSGKKHHGKVKFSMNGRQRQVSERSRGLLDSDAQESTTTGITLVEPRT